MIQHLGNRMRLKTSDRMRDFDVQPGKRALRNASDNVKAQFLHHQGG